VAVGIFANRTLATPDVVVEGQKRGLPEHRAVLDAILARDADAAAAASRRLLDNWLRRYEV
jgi:DNA-binding FadR family transcriptional regulator